MGNKNSSSNNRGRLLETLADHDEGINCLAVSDDESLLVTGSEDCTARMWSTRTKETECLGVLRGHTSYIISVSVSEAFVFTASADASVRKWDMTTCECLFIYLGHEARIQKAWIVDTSQINEGTEESACLRTFHGHKSSVYPLIYIPSQEGTADLLISGSADNTARSWSIDTGCCLKTFKGHTGAITNMSTDTEGKILYTTGGDSVIKSWNIKSGQCLRTMEGHTDSVICMFVTNRLMYTGSADTTAKCWITEFGDCTRTYKGHKHSVICLRFEKGTIFTGSGDGVSRAFEAKSGTLKRVFVGHESAINALAVVNDKLYTGSSDGTLRVWDASIVDENLNADENGINLNDSQILKSKKDLMDIHYDKNDIKEEE